MNTDHSTHEHTTDGLCLDGSGYSLHHDRPLPDLPETAYAPDARPIPPHTPAHLAPGVPSHEIPEGRHMAPIATLPPSEFLMSLTGFDEIAIAARFGTPLTALREDPIAAGRAMAFVHYRRAGQNDNDAHQAALALTLREVSEFFVPEPKAASAEGNDDGAQ